ncbi:MAG TPA: hypothetical protein VL295_06545 [Gemmatimonadales bacterium]|nr:hypothetical protein [Gemmatimonadales bacterium]
MRTPLRAAERFTLAALLVLATATCTDQPTEPVGSHAGQVRFTPVFASNTFASGLPLDQVTVTVVRPAAETLAVRSAPFALTDSVLQLDIPVMLNAAAESLQVTIDLLSGATLLFSGTDTIEVTAGTGTTPPAITMTYVGPGANIAFLSIAPRDTVLRFGDTLDYTATAADALENPVGTFYLRWFTTPAGTPIRSDGRLIAPNVRATIMVHAWTPSGEQDSTTVTFAPVPTQIVKISGDFQSDTAGDTLAAPFIVEVRAADNLPVAGIPVTFAAVTAGGAIVVSDVATDSLGRASALAALGDTVRSYSYTATVAGLTPVTFTAVANAGPAALIAKVGGDAQSDTVGQQLPLPLVVRVADAADNPVAGAKVYWTRVAGTGTLEADSSLTQITGQTQIHYILGTPGVDTIRATLAGTGAFVDFTATAVAGGFSIVEISGNGQTDTVGRTLPVPMVAEVHIQGTPTPAPGVWVQFSILYGGGSVSVDSALSDSLGRVQVTYTLDTLAGAAEVMAETPTSGQYVTFQIIKVADAPDHFAAITPMPDTVQVGVVWAPQPAIQIRDSFENPVKTAGIYIQAITNGDYLAPPPPQLAAGGLQFSGSVRGVDSAATDANGTATFSGLSVLGTAGPEVMRFRVIGSPVGHLLQPFTLVAGLPNSVVPIAGNGQNAFVDSLVAIAPQVLVVDTSGNGVAGVTVNFVVTAGGGAVTGGTQITDSLGYATVGSWRMGSSPGADTLEAQVSGASPAVFTATAQPLTPTIQLTLLGTSVVGVGRTAPLQVRLSTPAPVGGVAVNLSSDDPGTVNVQDAIVNFAAGDSIKLDSLVGNAAGPANITATAPGYDPDTLAVIGSLNLISLPTSLNVPFGSDASIAVTLGQPAPAGGVAVTLVSSDPSLVSIVTPTVNIPQGATSANGTVHGVALGTVTVTASNPNYAPDQSSVSTTATLNITAASLSAFSTFGAQVTTEFRSNGILTPAPAGGITVDFTPRDPTCVMAPTTTVIPQGQTSIADSIGYGGSAPLPCVTYLVATAPGIDPDSVQVTINPPPAATLNFSTAEVGSGLQYGSYGVNLAVSTHGGRLISVRSLDTTKVLVQLNNATAGTDSIGVFVPNGTSSTSFWVAGKEGITSDSALVVTEVPGFRPDTAKIYVRQAAFELAGVPGSVNIFAGNSNVYVQMGIGNVANTFMNAYQGPRVGGTLGRLATVALSSSGVAQLIDSTATPDTVKTATFPVGQYYTPTTLPGGMQIDPIGVGTVSVTATVPGLVPLPGAVRTYSVTPAAITFSSSTAEVGSGLQYGSYGVNLSGSSHPPTAVKLRVLTPGVALVQPDANTAGTDSIFVNFPDGTANLSFWIAGVEGILNDTAFVVAEAPGFTSDTMPIFVRQPVIELANIPTTTGSLSANGTFWVQIGIGNVGNSFMNAYQGPRVGGTLGRVASVTVTPGTVALLRDSTATPDSTKTVTIPVGQYYSPTSMPNGLQFDPATPGVATFTASLSGFATLPTAVRTMTVTGPSLNLNSATAEIGSGLQYGSYGISLSASNHGGVTATLRTLTPGVAVLQADANTTGDSVLTIPFANGVANANFWLGGLEGITSDSVLVVGDVPGFVPDTMKVYVRRPAFELANIPATTTTLSPNGALWVQMGIANVAGTFMNAYQGSRHGGTPPTFTVRSNGPTVVRIIDSAGFGDSLPITPPAGQYYTPTSVASGGLGWDPLTTGSTQIVATHPTFLPLPNATIPITVSTPGITVNGGTVGSGLQRSQSFSLGASQHGGVIVKVWSTAPSIAKVSPDANTPGTDTVYIPVANGNTGGSFYLQGMEGQTGSPTIQVSAPGFTDGSASVTVVQPAIELANVPSAPSAGAANQAFWAQVGVANGIYTTMNEYQNIRAGGADSLAVTFTNSNGSAAQLTTLNGGTGNTVTAWIIPGRYYTPTSFASGGVAFDPFAAGATVVNATLAGFVQLPTATVNVNVGP